jgi:hypothetical protein
MVYTVSHVLGLFVKGKPRQGSLTVTAVASAKEFGCDTAAAPSRKWNCKVLGHRKIAQLSDNTSLCSQSLSIHKRFKENSARHVESQDNYTSYFNRIHLHSVIVDMLVNPTNPLTENAIGS